MSSRWSWLLPLLVLPSGWAPSKADVGDFTPCLQFFYQAWPPKGLAGTPVCQRFHNRYRFATLYNRTRRSPWFSAYLYTMPTGKRPLPYWKFEPQLADPRADGNMVSFDRHGFIDLHVVESQAVMPDYTNSSFTRGHLNPSLHHDCNVTRAATFTLTNVVPQKSGSNDGPWTFLEQRVNKTVAQYCLGDAYIVTGVIPYRDDKRWLKNRVAVPEYMWSAYCCPHYNRSLPEELQDAFPTYAAIGRNDANSSEEIVPVDRTAKKEFVGYDVRLMSLETLEMYLEERFNAVVSVFYQRCGGSR